MITDQSKFVTGLIRMQPEATPAHLKELDFPMTNEPGPTLVPSETTPLVLGVVEDLFFGVKIADAAKKAGGRMLFMKTEDALLARSAESPALIVFDLHYQSMEPLRMIAALKANPATAAVPQLAFFSHVHEDLRRAAIDAGCDLVMPRSAFTSKVNDLVAEAIARAGNSKPAPPV